MKQYEYLRITNTLPNINKNGYNFACFVYIHGIGMNIYKTSKIRHITSGPYNEYMNYCYI